MKKQFKSLSFYFFALFICSFLYFHVEDVNAQSSYTKKIKVTVTDEMNGYPTVIDTILPNQAAAQRFLRVNGYDDAGINRAASISKGKRKISVRTKEILESDYYNVETGEVNLDKYFKIPPGATVTETDGIREINWVETDTYGNLTSRSATVRVGKRKRLPEKSTTYETIGPQTSIRSNTPKNTEYVKEMSSIRINPTINSYPKFTIKIATTDIFDLNTLNGKADWLPMASGLKVENFIVTPDYDAEKFVLSFDLEQAAEDTKLEIFDVVGFPIHSEDLSNFTGTYSEFLPKFNLYSRDTYLVMITQKSTSQKFTQKITID